MYIHILNNFLTQNDTKRETYGHIFRTNVQLSILRLPVLSFILTILYHPPASLPRRRKESGGRQTRRRGAGEKRSPIGSIFADRRCQNSFASLAAGPLLDHASQSLANDTQLQLESQRCYVTRRGVICPARRVENRRDRRCLAVGIVSDLVPRRHYRESRFFSSDIWNVTQRYAICFLGARTAFSSRNAACRRGRYR